ncbi:hypothetical protein C6361_33305 [Plantactinospora sp. BC1]|nr:hypothetical protein C6361_33305 [Plantactinospora sp. BC1]
MRPRFARGKTTSRAHCRAGCTDGADDAVCTDGADGEVCTDGADGEVCTDGADGAVCTGRPGAGSRTGRITVAASCSGRADVGAARTRAPGRWVHGRGSSTVCAGKVCSPGPATALSPPPAISGRGGA